MTAEDAFEAVIRMWPDTVDLSSAIIHNNGGATIPALVAAHEIIEKWCIGQSDTYQAMGWAVFAELHAKSKAIIQAEGLSLTPSNLGIDEVLELYERNLDAIRTRDE